MSVRKTSAMALSFNTKSSPVLQLRRGDASSRSHIHGSNLSRIVRHVMLNDRRNRIRC